MTRRERLGRALTPVIQSLGAQQAVFGAAGNSSKKSPVHTVYAAFVHSVVCEVLDGMGLNPQAITSGRDFVFCCGRGTLPSTPNPFSYVEFTTGLNDYELHFGIEVACRSPGVCLELDLAIIEKRHSERCRSAGSSPSYRKLRLALEFKDYSRGVDVVAAKAFVGVCDRVRVKNKAAAGLVASGSINPTGALLLDGVNPSIACHGLVSGKQSDLAALNIFKTEISRELQTVL